MKVVIVVGAPPGRALVAINCPLPSFETMKVQYLSEERSSSYQPGFGAPITSSTCWETRFGSASYNWLLTKNATGPKLPENTEAGRCYI